MRSLLDRNFMESSQLVLQNVLLCEYSFMAVRHLVFKFSVKIQLN